jgi:hypothetical protein
MTLTATLSTAAQREPLQIGSEIKYSSQLWTVGAVYLTGGERYYFLIADKQVAFIPAFIIEPTA